MFDTTEGRDFIGNDAGIDADHATLQSFGDAPNTTDVTRVEIARQTEFSVVRHSDDISVSLESEQWCERAKGFLPGDHHVGCGVSNHSRLKKAVSQGMALATCQQAAPFGERIGDVFFHLFDCRAVNQRALRHTRFHTIADFEFLDCGYQFLRKRFVDAILHIKPVGADASLPSVTVLGHDRTLDGGIQIGIVKYDERRIAPEFQREFLDCLCALLRQHAADLGGTGERQFAYRGVGRHLTANGSGRPGHDAEDAGRYASALRQYCQSER